MNPNPVHAKASVLISEFFSFRVVSIIALALMIQLPIVSSSWAASASFQELVIYSRAVSADGKAVVGETISTYGDGGRLAARWTQNAGLELLDIIPGYNYSLARAASDDGGVIAGATGSINPYQPPQAFRYTLNGGIHFLGNGNFNFSSASGVSSDGSVIVGSGRERRLYGNWVALRWMAGHGLISLNVRSTRSFATDVSGDGNVIVGQAYRYGNNYFRWLNGGGVSFLKDGVSGEYIYNATTDVSVSPDGSVIVGRGRTASRLCDGGNEYSSGFLWTGKDRVMRCLGFSSPRAASNNGVIIVGMSKGEAYIWDEIYEARKLKQVLETEYGLDLTGWGLTVATDVSADGLTIVGYGKNPSGQQAGWVVKLDSLPSANELPLADAGIDRPEPGKTAILVDDVVKLDGSKSKDLDGDAITYQWSIDQAPASSSFTLVNNDTMTPEFTPNVEGLYTFKLIVYDGKAYSDPDYVDITVITATAAANDAVTSLENEVAIIDTTVLKNANQKNALTNKINAVLDLIALGDYQLALDKLQNDIKGKTDGCVDVNGDPDKNDWVKDCNVQIPLQDIISDAIYYLQKELGLI